MRGKQKNIKVLNAVIIDNRPDNITLKYDGIRHVMKTSEAQTLYFMFRKALSVTNPEEHKEIEIKIKGIDDKLCVLRSDIYNMWVKLKQIFRITY